MDPSDTKDEAMKVVAIARTNVRRMLRERSNIFFVFVFPLAIILLIGAQFGGDFNPGIGTFRADAGELSAAIVEGLEADGGTNRRILVIRRPEDGRGTWWCSGRGLPPERDG